MRNDKGKVRPPYTEEDKQKAIEFAKSMPDEPLKVVARTLEIPFSTLYTWLHPEWAAKSYERRRLRLDKPLREDRPHMRSQQNTKENEAMQIPKIEFTQGPGGRREYSKETIRDVVDFANNNPTMSYCKIARKLEIPAANVMRWLSKWPKSSDVPLRGRGTYNMSKSSLDRVTEAHIQKAIQLKSTEPRQEIVMACAQCEYLRKQVNTLKEDQKVIEERLATYRHMLKEVL